MNILTTPIDGVYVIETDRLSDHRGGFSRLFCDQSLSTILNSR